MASTKQIATIATLIALVHLGVVLQHGSDHAHLAIDMAAWQNAFIGAVIVVAPVLSAATLWLRRTKAWLWLFAVSMAGSLVFGLWYHFFAAGSDNVFGMAQKTGTAMFRITAVALALVEAVGVSWSLWTLQSKPFEPTIRDGKRIPAQTSL